jgi:hypothetical protein
MKSSHELFRPNARLPIAKPQSEETRGWAAVAYALAAFGILALIVVFAYFTDSFKEAQTLIEAVGSGFLLLHLSEVIRKIVAKERTSKK